MHLDYASIITSQEYLRYVGLMFLSYMSLSYLVLMSSSASCYCKCALCQLLVSLFRHTLSFHSILHSSFIFLVTSGNKKIFKKDL